MTRIRSHSAPATYTPPRDEAPQTSPKIPGKLPISEDEKDALTTYSMVSARLNRALRNDDITGPIRRKSELMDSAIQKLVASGRSTQAMLMRGISSTQTNKPANWFEEGTDFADKGFQSMTTALPVARAFARLGQEPENGVVIHTFNRQAADISEIAAHPDQKEHLVPRGSTSPVVFKGYDEGDKLWKVVLEGPTVSQAPASEAAAEPADAASIAELEALSAKNRKQESQLMTAAMEDGDAFKSVLERLDNLAVPNEMKAFLLFNDKDRDGTTAFVHAISGDNETTMRAAFARMHWLAPDQRANLLAEKSIGDESMLEIAVEMKSELLFSEMLKQVNQLGEDAKSTILAPIKDDPFVQKCMNSDAGRE